MPSSGTDPSGEPPLVAIIDDDASVRRSTRRLIQSFGYRAEAFASGDQFLDSPLAARTAYLLLDVRMPVMDGLEVQRPVGAIAPGSRAPGSRECLHERRGA